MTRDQEFIYKKVKEIGQQLLNDEDYLEYIDNNYSPYEAAEDMLNSITNWIGFINIEDRPEPDIEE